MSQTEALRRALAELGEVPAEELTAYMAVTYGVRVRPQFLPVLRATLRDCEVLAEWRRKAREAAVEPAQPPC